MRVRAHGKSFMLGASPFQLRGVRYRPGAGPAGSDDEALQLQRDLEAMAALGYTTVSLPPPGAWALEPAASSGLRFLLEVDDVDLGHVVRTSRRERRRAVREIALRIRQLARPWYGADALLGVALGVRRPLAPHAGAGPIQRAANELAAALHEDDAGVLAAWRVRCPVNDECPAEFDFLLADCELTSWDELPKALMACHGAVGDRPLVLGSVSFTGSDAPTPGPGWVAESVLRCGAGGTVAPQWPPREGNPTDSEAPSDHRRRVRDLDVDWPRISVVVTAYNAEATLEECLSHCDRLEYPALELIVVDDGSTDETTTIAAAHPRAQLVTIPHSGLSTARNAGYRSARGDLITYLDADAYPSPDWPWYIALAALGDRVGGAGGPNVPPPDETVSARVVAHSPGGPVPQLLGADRAEHVPGCNMAFWRDVLEQLQGFDPVIDGAEDVEFEWRVNESGYELGYHPAALIWHHRRPGLLPYLRQQRRYGRGQAILELRDPQRFPLGYRARQASRRLRPRRSDGASAASYPVRYLTLPRQEESALLALAHQWGVPAAFLLCATAPLALVRRRLAAPAAGAAAFVGALFAIDVVVAGTGRRRSERTLGFRARVAIARLLRPLAFRWGHWSGRRELRAVALDWPPPPVTQRPRVRP